MWGSCRIITPNLASAYRLEFGSRLREFSLTTELSDVGLWELACEIHAARPRKLVILDHAPHPGRLLELLAKVYGTSAMPQLFVHVYGDFTLYTANWLAIERLLHRMKVRFICASERQQRLLSRFVAPHATLVERCHFPVDTRVYRPVEQLRKAWRRKLGVSESEFLILYTGRLSLQKNVLLLTRNIMGLAKKLGKGARLRLVLAGRFDDIGARFFGVDLKPGFFFQQWKELLAQLGPELSSKVSYVGNQGPKELVGLYNAADVYASLSLHHDEDFGMAPAEALCCGTPVVLSDWGGFGSFASRPEACALVPTQIAEKGVRISTIDFERAVLQSCVRAADPAFRRRTGQHYSKSLSIGAARQTIAQIHSEEPPRFRGFTALMILHAQRMTSWDVLFPEGPRAGTFYERIYGAYTKTG